jgi:hypothetical protein
MVRNIGRSFAVQKSVEEVVVLGYGSLLHIDSLQRTLPGIVRDQLRLVRVCGYLRLFNLVMRGLVDRKIPITAQKVAALNAIIHVRGEMAGVAFAVDSAQLEAINRREFCYRQIRGVQAYDFISGEPVVKVVFYSVYSSGELKLKLPDFYRDEIEPLALEGLQHAGILPADDYLSLCLQGAYSWGEAFGAHFVDHTYLADGRTPLGQYIDCDEVERRRKLDLSNYIKNR